MEATSLKVEKGGKAQLPKTIYCTTLNIYACCKMSNMANATCNLKIVIKSHLQLHHEAWQEKQSFDYF